MGARCVLVNSTAEVSNYMHVMGILLIPCIKKGFVDSQ